MKVCSAGPLPSFFARFAALLVSPVSLALTITFSLLVLTGCGATGFSHPADPVAAPTVTITSSAPTITAGSADMLTVAAANATQVTVTGSDGSTFNLQPNGGTEAIKPTATTTYTANASGTGGKASATATVTVAAQAPPAAPTVAITANPAAINTGDSATLTVVATNAAQLTVTGSDASTYTLQPNGGSQAVSPGATTTYTATATGAAGTAPVTATATVTVTPPAPPAAPTVTLASNPATITLGSSSTLTVAAVNATLVTVIGSDGSTYALPLASGTQTVSPATTTIYTATATGTAGTSPAMATTTVTVVPPPPPPPPAAAVTIAANPASITAGSSSTLSVAAANATAVTVSGSDGSSYILPVNGGTQAVSPATTTTYTAHATGSAGTTPATAATVVTVVPPPPPPPPAATVTIAANPASITAGNSSTLTVAASNSTVVTVTGSDGSNYTLSVDGGTQAVSPTATTTYTAHATGATGSTPVTATATVTVSLGQPASGSANVVTWHFDTHRSGLNSGEQSLTPTNVHPASFGRLFSYLMDGYVYGQPLLMSNITVKGAAHNVLYAATENDSVYAFDADSYGTGAPLWHVSLLQSGETPLTSGPIKPFEGVTSTPVIDPATNTIYVVSAQVSSGSGASFRLNALDIATGAQKFGGPVTIHASVLATNSNSVNGIETLNNSCIQRAALLLANGNVYMGFGSCHSGWLLAYDASTLAQVGVFNASPNLNGEGKYASAGGIWMSGGGPVADGLGNVYVTTGNGPWDGQTAFGDSVLKFNAKLQLQDYFTPQDYQYMDCQDADLAAGGLLMIPGTSQLLAGGKTGKLYLVDESNLGHEQANDAGATQTLFFESDLTAPYSDTCTDATGGHTSTINSYEIFGSAAYFNGAVYLGVTPTNSTAPAGVRRFTYNGTLTPGSYTHDSAQQNARGTTPFLSANGNASGIMWFIDTGQPIQSPQTPTGATLRAFDALDLTNEIYNSSVNSGDTPGFGIKFSSPIVANGKVYISTGHDLPSVGNPQGELDVYGLK